MYFIPSKYKLLNSTDIILLSSALQLSRLVRVEVCVLHFLNSTSLYSFSFKMLHATNVLRIFLNCGSFYKHTWCFLCSFHVCLRTIWVCKSATSSGTRTHNIENDEWGSNYCKRNHKFNTFLNVYTRYSLGGNLTSLLIS